MFVRFVFLVEKKKNKQTNIKHHLINQGEEHSVNEHAITSSHQAIPSCVSQTLEAFLFSKDKVPQSKTSKTEGCTPTLELTRDRSLDDVRLSAAVFPDAL